MSEELSMLTKRVDELDRRVESVEESSLLNGAKVDGAVERVRIVEETSIRIERKVDSVLDAVLALTRETANTSAWKRGLGVIAAAFVIAVVGGLVSIAFGRVAPPEEIVEQGDGIGSEDAMVGGGVVVDGRWAGSSNQ